MMPVKEKNSFQKMLMAASLRRSWKNTYLAIYGSTGRLVFFFYQESHLSIKTEVERNPSKIKREYIRWNKVLIHFSPSLPADINACFTLQDYRTTLIPDIRQWLHVQALTYVITNLQTTLCATLRFRDININLRINFY